MTYIADRDPYRIGILATIGLVVFMLGLATLSTMSFGTKDYAAQLEHTAGLRVGEAVQVAGVPVGEVTAIKLDGSRVNAQFTLDREIKLGTGTEANVKVATLLGTHYLEVNPVGGGELKESTIPLAQTSVPFNLQEIVNAAGKSLKEYDQEKIGKSLSVMAETLNGTPESARDAMKGVSALSRTAAKRSEQMRSLLSSTSTVTTRLADNSEQIINLLEQSNLVLDELVARRDAIRQMLVDTERLAEAITGIIDDNEKELAPLMADFSTTLDLLRKHEKSVIASIDSLGTTAKYFANATGNGPWMDLRVPVPLSDNLACAANPDCRK